jgi:hypothetical protein
VSGGPAGTDAKSVGPFRAAGSRLATRSDIVCVRTRLDNHSRDLQRSVA